ncbi:MAG: hypothetical protein NC485_15050 [Ruminococcus flavefaciens]|nr:hypothetical protein [Ruminococcus flavefaciens]
MTILKKICIVISLFFLSGCSSQTYDGSFVKNNKNEDLYSNKNQTVNIYNVQDEVIGEIEHYGQMTLLDDSIIFTKCPQNSDNDITEMEYYRYYLNSNEIIKIGTIENWAYEAVYCNILHDDHLYMLISTGEILYPEKRYLDLYDIDLSTNAMSKLTSQHGGFPYSSMAYNEDKLYIIKLISTGGCYLEEYNIKSKDSKVLMNFEYDAKTDTGEMIRQIFSFDDFISLLKIKYETLNDISLYIDIYDTKMNLQSSIDISSISDDINQLAQGVSDFTVVDNYFYYGNFSTLRYLGEFNERSIKSIQNTNSTFEMATDVSPRNDSSLFYQSFSSDNDLYLFDYSNGSIKKSSFELDDDRYYITNMSRNSNDGLLFTMSYKDAFTGEELNPRLYYVNMYELDFN